jgi:putative phosphoribosyl transferase
MAMIFTDRRDAGRRLAEALRPVAAGKDVLVLGLPRGGIPVAYEVASALDAPLDVFVVRKLGAPGQPELAMGAIASGGVRILNEDVIDALHVPPEAVEFVAEAEQRELERREREYRGARPLPEVHGRAVIIVDDGLATGATMMAAIQALRRRDPSQIIAAAPTGAEETCQAIRTAADACVCLQCPSPFYGVGQSYADFSQTSDDEVRGLLEAASRSHATGVTPR